MFPVTSFTVQNCWAAGVTTVKNWKFDVPPPGPGLTTAIVAVLGVAMSDAVIAAFSFEELTNVVARGPPFQYTTDPETKPMPVTVMVKAGPPGAVDAGTIGSRCGTGLGVVARVDPAAMKDPSTTRTASRALYETIVFMKAPLQSDLNFPRRGWGRPISAQPARPTLLVDDAVRKSAISFCNIRDLWLMGYELIEFFVAGRFLKFHIAIILDKHCLTTLKPVLPQAAWKMPCDRAVDCSKLIPPGGQQCMRVEQRFEDDRNSRCNRH
jgi:hypothetical protein